MASFVRAGGYDTSFVANEDAELDCRQRALGARLYLDADIRLRYMPRATPGRLWAQYRRYGQGRARTVQRHPASLRARQLAVPVFMLGAVAALGGSPWWPALLAWPGLYGLALVLGSVHLAARHGSPVALLAGAAAVVMHSAWAFGFLEGMLTRRERRWRPEAARPLALLRSACAAP
jgi:succinoglycan biosynthesis protein ExoA